MLSDSLLAIFKEKPRLWKGLPQGQQLCLSPASPKPNTLGIAGDGHCAYRALALALTGCRLNADAMRVLLMHELRCAHGDKCAWVRRLFDHDEDVEKYAVDHEKADVTAWGGNKDFTIAAHVFSATIYVRMQNTPLCRTNS